MHVPNITCMSSVFVYTRLAVYNTRTTPQCYVSKDEIFKHTPADTWMTLWHSVKEKQASSHSQRHDACIHITSQRHVCHETEFACKLFHRTSIMSRNSEWIWTFKGWRELKSHTVLTQSMRWFCYWEHGF